MNRHPAVIILEAILMGIPIEIDRMQYTLEEGVLHGVYRLQRDDNTVEIHRRASYCILEFLDIVTPTSENQLDVIMANIAFNKAKQEDRSEKEEGRKPAAPTTRLKVDIYSDGSCSPNPGPGGWGALLQMGGKEKEIFGGDPDTTNNRMELTAVIKSLQALKLPCDAVIHTDSQYVQKGFTEYLPVWIEKGWKKTNGKPVENADLWQVLVEVINQRVEEGYTVEWDWVRGHNGDAGNERADKLALKGRESLV